MGLKEKLPLINSDNKGIRITGYVVYAFVFLMLLGAVLPSHDEAISVSSEAETPSVGSEANTSKEEILTPDENWTSQVLANEIMMLLYEHEGVKAVSDYDTVVSTQKFSEMNSVAEDALVESQNSNVSEKYLPAKALYEDGLRKYISASSNMLRSIRSTNQEKGLRLLDDATSDLVDADNIMADTEAELNKVDPNWAGSEEK